MNVDEEALVARLPQQVGVAAAALVENAVLQTVSQSSREKCPDDGTEVDALWIVTHSSRVMRRIPYLP